MMWSLHTGSQSVQICLDFQSVMFTSTSLHFIDFIEFITCHASVNTQELIVKLKLIRDLLALAFDFFFDILSQNNNFNLFLVVQLSTVQTACVRQVFLLTQ